MVEIDELERVLLRSIIERKETCRQAAEAVMAYLRTESEKPENLFRVYGPKPVEE